MLEPPSEQLQRLLTQFRLCTPSDLRRCRRLVRRLAHDLPAFDSVWIDALVQAGRLTSFQARVLESPHPEQLGVGPCVLVDQLGRGHSGATFLARHVDSAERCVLKRMTFPPETLPPVVERLNQLVQTARSLSHPHVVAPHLCKVLAPAAADGRGRSSPADPTDVVLLSRHVPGLTLKELLIRRGRFSPTVVYEIGRQLLDGLAALEARGLVHGDIGPSNVRLTAKGQAVLVDAGVRPAVEPELSLHAARSPERYDGVAPERIGTAAPATVLSDLYALGCLLWTLLAGRPPFPTGDPLAKLAAHQTQPVPDVREWSPDTPAPLAGLIAHLTAFQPDDRPQSAAEALQAWGRPTRFGQRRLRQFRAQFDVSVPNVPPPAGSRSSGRWSVLVALVFALSGLTLGLLDRGARGYLLDLAGRLPLARTLTAPLTGSTASLHRAVQPTADGASATNASQRFEPTPSTGGNSLADRPAADERLLPIPAPDAEGVVLLDHDGPYRATDLSTAGPLVLRGVDGAAPTIVVDSSPLRIWAQEVLLDNVRLVTAEVWRAARAGVAATAAQASDTAASGSRRLSPELPTPTDSPSQRRRPTALLLVRSHTFTARSCLFQTGPVDSSEHASRVGDSTATSTASGSDQPQRPTAASGAGGGTELLVAAAWKPLDASAATSKLVAFEDCVFAGPSAAVYVGGDAQLLSFSNCLKLGGGAFLHVAAVELAGRTLQVELSHVTLRDSGPLLRLLWPAGRSSLLPQSAAFRLKVRARQCVFGLAPQKGSLLEWLGPDPGPSWLTGVELRGGGSLVPPNVGLASVVQLPEGERQPVPAERVNVEGLFAASFRFAGPVSSDWKTSLLTFYDTPRFDTRPPGVDPARLPTLPRPTGP